MIHLLFPEKKIEIELIIMMTINSMEPNIVNSSDKDRGINSDKINPA